MARIALTVAGYALGAAVGQPMLGAWAGGMLGAYLFPETIADAPAQDDSDLQNIQVQTAAYGEPIRRVWGSMRLAGNLIWLSPIVRTETDWTLPGGTPFTVDMAIGVCVGPVAKILRIWADRQLLYDVREGNANIVQATNINATIYLGTETQTADPTIESYEGSGNVPAYRGLCYIVLQDFPLQFFGNHIPNFEFEVATNLNPDVETYAELDGLTASATDRDNIIFHPDELHFTIVSDGSWHKFYTLTNTLVLSKEHQSPKIPANDGGGFDIDENNIIHTIKVSSGSQDVLCRLDGETFAEIAASTDIIYYSFERIRVFRTDTHPYVVVIHGAVSANALYITNRYTYTFGGGVDEIILSPPSGTEWASIDLDEDEGIIWAVCKSTNATPESRLVKITVFTDGSYTQQIWDITSNIDDPDAVLYDSDTDTLVVASDSDNKIIFFDADTMTFDSVNVLPVLPAEDITGDVKSSWRRGTFNGYLYYAAPQPDTYRYIVHGLDIVNRKTDLRWRIALTDCDSLGGYGGSCYCQLTHSIILVCPATSSTSDYTKYLLDRSAALKLSLSSIVEDICEDVGLDDSGDLDTSELTNLVQGFAVTRQISARSALKSLMSAYFFDIVDSGGVLKFVKRGGDAIFDLAEDDLAAHSIGEQRPQITVSNRQQELELAASIDLMYVDYDADYVTAIQRENRLNTQSREKVSLRFPIVLDKDEAKQICVKHLANVWMQRTRHLIATHREFSYLDPADVGTITRGDATYTVRIEEVSFRGGMIILKTVEENATVYESDAIGNDVPEGGDDEIDYTGHTLLLLIDCSLIRATENSPGVQVVTLGYGDQWTGASIFKSDSDTWPLQQPWAMTTKDATIAKSLDVLGDVTDPWIWDEGNSLNVSLIDSTDSLSSATKADVLNGSNLAILGDEIIQWRTATLESDGTYTLTGLLRGRRGSEWATGSHAVGEYFILLDTTNVAFEEVSIDEDGVVKWYRPQSFGMGWNTGTVQSFTFAANNMKPWSPERIAGSRDGSNNLTITWIRRTRMNGEWTDGGDVALGETTEAYEVDILDGSTVVRTIEVTSESAIYTAAQQVTDFGSTQSSLDVIIYQISSVVDRGFGTEATV
jgi:hypothetical protein